MLFRSSTKVAVSLLLFSALSSGCAHQLGSMMGEASGEIPGPVIQESLRAMNDEETRQLLVGALSNPDVRDATGALIANVTDGSLDALSDEERSARLATMAEGFVGTVSHSLATSLEHEIAPAMTRALSRSLTASLRRLASEENRAVMSEAVGALARDSAGAMALAIREQMAPAMAAAIRDELAPAMRGAFADEETQRTLALSTRTLSRELILGIQDAFEEIDTRHEQGRESETILTRLQSLAANGASGLTGLWIGLLVIGILFLGVVAWAIMRVRQHIAESRRREAALLALAGAIKSTEDRPWSGELLDVLKESFRDNEHAAYLRDVLRQNQLRLQRSDRPRGGSSRGFGPGAPAPAE